MRAAPARGSPPARRLAVTQRVTTSTAGPPSSSASAVLAKTFLRSDVWMNSGSTAPPPRSEFGQRRSICPLRGGGTNGERRMEVVTHSLGERNSLISLPSWLDHVEPSCPGVRCVGAVFFWGGGGLVGGFYFETQNKHTFKLKNRLQV